MSAFKLITNDALFVDSYSFKKRSNEARMKQRVLPVKWLIELTASDMLPNSHKQSFSSSKRKDKFFSTVSKGHITT